MEFSLVLVKGFLRWYTTLRIAGFLDFVHRPKFQILENTTFGNWICFRPQGREMPTLLALLRSSD
jgi:hypothetical protein